MRVYICFCCSYPIIFRRWRGNPRQVFHIPTGWPCWNMWGAGLCRPGLPQKLAFPSTTALKERRRFLREANKHLRMYLRTGNTKPLVNFANRQLEANRGDVIGDLLTRLGDEEEEQTRPLFRSLVGSRAWKEYCRQLKRDRLYADYREARDATPVIQYLQGLLARGDAEEALEISERALDLVQDEESKVMCWYAGICAREFAGDRQDADREMERLTEYFKGLEESVRVTKRGLGLLLATIQRRLDADRRERVLSLFSFLAGEAELD